MALKFIFIIAYLSAIFIAFLMIAKTFGSIQNLFSRLESLLSQEMELLLKKEAIRKALFEADKADAKKMAQAEEEAASPPPKK
jgi:hypothetical protein